MGVNAACMAPTVGWVATAEAMAAPRMGLWVPSVRGLSQPRRWAASQARTCCRVMHHCSPQLATWSVVKSR